VGDLLGRGFEPARQPVHDRDRQRAVDLREDDRKFATSVEMRVRAGLDLT
jgi:hypothetical protein